MTTADVGAVSDCYPAPEFLVGGQDAALVPDAGCNAGTGEIKPQSSPRPYAVGSNGPGRIKIGSDIALGTPVYEALQFSYPAIEQDLAQWKPGSRGQARCLPPLGSVALM